MSSGGGSRSSAPTEQTVYQSTLPEYVKPDVQAMLRRADTISRQQYTPFNQQRLEYFSPDELASQAMTRSFASQAPQGYNVGLGRAFQTAAYQPLGYEQNLNRFMNPYQQNVIDIQKREARRDAAMNRQNIMGQAAQSGGLGGYREAILQAENLRNLGQRVDDIQGQGLNAAFLNAQRQLGQERADRRAASALGLSGAQAIPQFLQGRSQDAISRIAALSKLGEQQRSMRQAGRDLAYQDFLRQSQFPQTQLGFYSNILRGVPIQPNRAVSTYQQQPGLFQSLVGLGLGGLGMYRGVS
jgi:hypothetical protein